MDADFFVGFLGDLFDVHAAAALAMITGLPRAIEHDARGSSRVIRSPSSISTRPTTRPSGPVWWVMRVMPIMSFASWTAWAGLFASLTPPPLPRPPAWICALTTTTAPPRRLAIS